MRKIPQHFQVLYSELAQRAIDGDFASEFDPAGRFISSEVKGRRYWYFDRSAGGGKKQRTYVGPCDDVEITRRVEEFRELKDDIRERRRMVSVLKREAGLPGPDSLSGNLVEALARAGFFRMRGVLVGTMAFGAYPALLGVRLPGASMITSDIDFAQFHSISVAVEDTMPPMLDVLRGVDDTFRAVPHMSGNARSSQFVSRSKFKVEFLTPNRGADSFGDEPAPMPALGGASAQPLRFLDYLIRDPQRAVLLHRHGVAIKIPAPERYAVHKLIVSERRRKDQDGTAKSRKDLTQSTLIMEALILQRRQDDLAEAFVEAINRGPAWEGAIRAAFHRFPEPERERFSDEIIGGIARLRMDPAAYAETLGAGGPRQIESRAPIGDNGGLEDGPSGF